MSRIGWLSLAVVLVLVPARPQARQPAAPTSVNDAYATAFRTPIMVAAPGVLGDDLTNGGGSMTAILMTRTEGAVTLNSDGSFTYSPSSYFTGVDAFIYRAVNTTGMGNSALVSITVAPPAGVPVPLAVDDRYTVGANGSIAVDGPGLMANDDPRSSFPASVDLLSQPSHGSLVLMSGGFVYTPFVNLVGPSAPATATFTVLPAGVPVPVAGFRVVAMTGNLVTFAWTPPTSGPPLNLIGGAAWNTLNLAWLPGFAGGPPTGAVLEASGSAAVVLPLGNVDSLSLDSIPPGTYTLAVRQTGPGGLSARSGPVTLTFPAGCLGAEVPRPPRNVQVYKAGGTLHVHWEPAVDGPAPSGYRLDVYDPFTGTIPVVGRSFRTAPPPGVYQFAVVALNACGVSAASPVQRVVFP